MLILVSSKLYSQTCTPVNCNTCNELVPNGDFETWDGNMSAPWSSFPVPPGYSYSMSHLSCWQNYPSGGGSSCDFFVRNNTLSPDYSIPNNTYYSPVYTTDSHSSSSACSVPNNNFIGFGAGSINSAPVYSEGLSVQLTQTLTNQPYTFSCWIRASVILGGTIPLGTPIQFAVTASLRNNLAAPYLNSAQTKYKMDQVIYRSSPSFETMYSPGVVTNGPWNSVWVHITGTFTPNATILSSTTAPYLILQMSTDATTSTPQSYYFYNYAFWDDISIQPAVQCCSLADPDDVEVNNITTTQLGALYNTSPYDYNSNPDIYEQGCGNTSSVLYIMGTLTVNSNFTFLHCPNIKMGPGSKINILPNYKLSIIASHLQASCPAMWDGIYESAATSDIMTNVDNTCKPTIIEDAYNAIVATNGAGVHLTETTFNRNYRDVWIKNCTGTGGAYPCSIVSCLFTCINPASLPGFPNTLLSPHLGELKYAAIQIDNVSKLVTIGNSTASSYINSIDRANHGIVAWNSNTTIIHNRISNILYTNADVNSGTGIFALDLFNPLSPVKITIGGYGTNMSNTITDALTGISILHQNADIFNNAISRATLKYNAKGIYTKLCNYAPVAPATSGCTLAIDGNTINNVCRGIECYQNTNAAQTIKNNTITLDNSAVTIWNKEGIRVDDNPLPQTSWTIINNNTIANGRHGIDVRQTLYPQIHDNTITVPYDWNFPPIVEQTGIIAVGAFLPFINCNSIQGNGSNSSQWYANEKSGIYCGTTAYEQIFCNTTSATKHGLRFVGSCPSTDGIYGNQLYTHQYGLTLWNSGYIGNQHLNGSTGTANQTNRFFGNTSGTGIFSGATLCCKNSNGAAQTLYCKTTNNTYTPFNNALILSTPFIISTDALNDYTCSSSCLYTPAYRMSDTAREAAAQAANQLAEGIAGDELDYPIMPESVEWTSKYQLYSMLLNHYADTSLLNSESEAFYADNHETSVGLVCRASKALAEGNTSEALSLLDNLHDNLIPPTNFKSILTWLCIARDSITDSLRYASLLSIASQCPVNGGPAVYIAQSLIREFNDTISFSDDYACSNANTARMNGNEEESIYYFEKNAKENMNSTSIILSPNPANHEITITYHNNYFDGSKIAIVKIFNSVGQQVSNGLVKPSSNSINYNIDKLPNGNFIAVVVIGGNSFHSKFTILH